MSQNQDFDKKFDSNPNNSKVDLDLQSDLKSDIQGEVDFENPPPVADSTGSSQNQAPTSQPNPVNNIGSKPVSEQIMGPEKVSPNPNLGIPEAPTSPKKKIWLWIIIGIFVLMFLGLGGLAFASYKGWVNIGLAEYFGGISGNPYKALYQVANQSSDIQEFEYSCDFKFTTRMDAGQTDISKGEIQESASANIVSTVYRMLNFPNTIFPNPLPGKILGESTSKTATDFEFQISGKFIETAASAQYKLKLPSQAEAEMYNQYLEPFANADDEIILENINDLEKNNLYFQVSSISTDDNPWIKFTIPESSMPKDQNFNDALQEQLKDLEDIKLEDFQDLFKEVDNYGIETINSTLVYHFSYLTDVKTLYEFTEKLNDSENIYPSYEQDNFDLSFDVWLGVFDQLVYKFDFDFTTQESSIGSIQFDSSVGFKYQDISVDIPSDSECVGSICDSAIGDIGFVKELCQNPLYREMFDSLSADLEDDQSSDSAQARDTQRKSDLRSMQTALELYNNENGKYPISTEISKTNNKNGIIYQALIEISEKVPVDPNDPNWYYAYKTNADGTAYEITCLIEAPSNPEDHEKIGTGYLYKVGIGSI